MYRIWWAAVMARIFAVVVPSLRAVSGIHWSKPEASVARLRASGIHRLSHWITFAIQAGSASI
jgi:hypothetical protein